MSHLSSSPVPQHCTTVNGWGLWPLHPTYPRASAHFLQQWWGNMPEPLLKGLTVSDSNLMLNCASAAKFIPIQCKNIMEGQYKVSHHSGILRSPVAKAIQIQLFQECPLLLSYRQGLLPGLCPPGPLPSPEITLQVGLAMQKPPW